MGKCPESYLIDNIKENVKFFSNSKNQERVKARELRGKKRDELEAELEKWRQVRLILNNFINLNN